MRRILIDRADKKQTLKRGVERKRMELNDVALAENQEIDQLLELNESLDGLEAKTRALPNWSSCDFSLG